MPPLNTTTVVAAVAPDDNDDVLRIGWIRASTTGRRLIACAVVEELADLPAAYESLTRRTRDQLPRGAAAEVDVRVGDRAEKILECATAWDAGLLVVGPASHHEGLLARFFSPSLPTALVRAAHCPILVSRYAPATGRILVAVDLRQPEPVLRAAAAEVARGGGQVHVLHCIAPVPVVSTMDMPMTAAVSTADLVNGARADLESAMSAARLRATPRIEIGAPGDTVLDVARELSADLIVVGTHGRSGPARLLLGSTAETILRDARCSVMVIRTPSE